MDIIRQAAQEIVADRNKIKNTDIKCGVSITDVIETELTDKRTAVDKVIADRNIIEVEDILGAVKVPDLLPEKEEPVPAAPKSIAITTPPTKTTYVVGETIDTTGMVVTVSYEDGSEEEISDYTYSPTAPLTLEDTQITVTAFDLEDSYAITVTEQEIVEE